MSLLEAIAGKQNIVLTAHAFADADAVGSLIALADFLEQKGVNVTVAIAKGAPKNLKFLVGQRNIVMAGEFVWQGYDLIFVLDCSSPDLTHLPGISSIAKENIVNIDHHPDNTLFGIHNFLDTHSASTAEIVYKMLKESAAELTGNQATALLAGIMGDTGSFKHNNTTEEVLRDAGELMYAGANLRKISRYLFTRKDYAQLNAWAYVLENAYYDELTGAIISALTEEEIASLGVTDDVFDGVVELLNTHESASFAVFVRQRGDEIKVSLRSENFKGVDVGAMAAGFGGGGHRLAAGFSLPGKLTKSPAGLFVTPGV